MEVHDCRVPVGPVGRRGTCLAVAKEPVDVVSTQDQIEGLVCLVNELRKDILNRNQVHRVSELFVRELITIKVRICSERVDKHERWFRCIIRGWHLASVSNYRRKLCTFRSTRQSAHPTSMPPK